jgi:ABC-type Co2+ transport system permease subunit
MHIAEGFLPPAHALGWSLAAPFVVHGARAVVLLFQALLLARDVVDLVAALPEHLEVPT